MDGWMGGWVEVKVVSRIAYCNQKRVFLNRFFTFTINKKYFWGRWVQNLYIQNTEIKTWIPQTWVDEDHTALPQYFVSEIALKKSMWMDGWVGGGKSCFKDCLQQSKIVVKTI